MTMRSIQEPCLCAASTPRGTATSTAIRMVKNASESVGSMRSPIREATVFLKKKLSPKSPVSTLPDQMTNCSIIGRSRPSWPRILATCSALALSPAMIAAGSDGVRRSIRKMKTATTSITGIAPSSRRNR
ncbi:hypothetical protein ES707_18429 [subsurface metagenome]